LFFFRDVKDKIISSFYFRGIAEVSNNIYLMTSQAIYLTKKSGQKPPPLGPNRVKMIFFQKYSCAKSAKTE
jgi:hypothetical protein